MLQSLAALQIVVIHMTTEAHFSRNGENHGGLRHFDEEDPVPVLSIVRQGYPPIICLI